ncbi:GspE/PulE family protein [Sphingomonas sp.]|uniref:GspE/PulE family protein n=1 Tax=Sphingomonas sp. TaxID=28214 RepID=UPI0025EA15FD|nr:GspE/PulE family protein [Sphingomonas sp.]
MDNLAVVRRQDTRNGIASGDGTDRPISLEDVLRTRSVLTDEALDRALLVQRGSGERLDSVLTRLGLLTEASLADLIAEASGLPTIGLSEYPAVAVGNVDLSIGFLHDMRCVPVARTSEVAVVAVVNPFDNFVKRSMVFMFGVPVRLVVGRASDIDVVIERLYRTGTQEAESDPQVEGEDLERLKDLVSDAPVIRAVNRMIAMATDARASDIHVEPTDDSLAIRFRIDGMLRDMPPLPAAMRASIVSRIKIMAGLNIAERRLPQDGRLRLAVRGHEIDLRVATAPSIHGESVVMRILDRSKLALDFDALGFSEDLTTHLRAAINTPHGIVLVTGPTGSGKTTTLYAALAELNKRERKLLTVEDPIEYRLPGVIQTQVNPAIGFTFGAALRSFLRQDPDVMMVGEIRDSETAEIAVQAALTGHMILSTLHTNTAPGAVTRLLDMGVEPLLLSSVLTAVVAQRLVRRLCPSCREEQAADAALGPLFARAGLALPDTLFRAVGCEHCSNNGYTGRVAIFELLIVDAEIAGLILTGSNMREIAEAAARKSMRSLLNDGLMRATQGLTSVEEVLRVVSED